MMEHGISNELKRYEGLIRKIVNNFFSLLPGRVKSVVSVEDLQQVGRIAVWELLSPPYDYRLSPGADLIKKTICCDIVDYLRARKIFLRSNQAGYRQYPEFFIEDIIQDINRVNAGDDCCLDDLLQNADTVTPEENVRVVEIIELVRLIVGEKGLVILAKHMKGMTFAEIARDEEVDESRICQKVNEMRGRLANLLPPEYRPRGKDFFPSGKVGCGAKLILQALSENRGEFVDMMSDIRLRLIEAGYISANLSVMKIKEYISKCLEILRRYGYVVKTKRCPNGSSEMRVRLVQ